MSDNSKDQVQATFDAHAPQYDSLRRKLIPCFDDFYRSAIDVLPFEHTKPIRVLDLGAGTGIMSHFVLCAYVNAHITLMDFSEAMLLKARKSFGGREEQMDFLAADYTASPLPSGFDVVISALSIHHLADDQKSALFGRIHDALNPGGIFVNADNVRHPSDEMQQRYRNLWIARMRELGTSEEELAAALERTKLDRLGELDTQLQWLRESGFADVHCHYKWLHFAVFSGRKTS